MELKPIDHLAKYVGLNLDKANVDYLKCLTLLGYDSFTVFMRKVSLNGVSHNKYDIYLIDSTKEAYTKNFIYYNWNAINPIAPMMDIVIRKSKCNEKLNKSAEFMSLMDILPVAIMKEGQNPDILDEKDMHAFYKKMHKGMVDFVPEVYEKNKETLEKLQEAFSADKTNS